MRAKIALLILLFLFCQIVNSALPRPWNNPLWLVNNSNILYINSKDVWFPGLFETSVDGLKLEKIEEQEIGDIHFKSLINKAIKNKGETAVAAKKCADVYADIKNNPTKKLDEILNKSAGEAWKDASIGAAAGALIFGTASGGALAIPGAIAGGVVGGAIGGLSTIFGALFSNTQDDRIVELTDTCSDYGKKWRALMDSTMDVVDYSFEELKEKWDMALNSYEKLRYAGVCDEDYYSTGRETCDYIKDIVSSEYGTYSPGIIELRKELRNGLSNQIPNTGAYYEIVMAIWEDNGSVGEAKDLAKLAEQKLTDAEDNAKMLLRLTEELKDETNKKLEELEKEKPEKIAESFLISEIVSSEKKETISKMFSEIKTNVEQATKKYNNAKLIYATKKISYVKNSVAMLKDIENTYQNIDENIDTINNEIEEIVEEKQKEAAALLDEFEKITKDKFVPDDAIKNYENAKSDFEKVSSANALGDKFEYLEYAAANARFAINIFENKPLEKIVNIKAAIRNAKELIKAAENDGIDASSENEEMKLIEKIEESWVLDNVKNIEDSILTKAKILYGDLENKRRLLLRQIELGKEATADLRTTMLAAEKNAFYSDGRIDYRNAIGRLKEIEATYKEIEAELEKSRKDIVLNALEKASDVSFDVVELDKPTDISITFAISNSFGYGADNAAVEFEFPYDLEIFKSEVNDNNIAEIIKTRGKTKLILKKIEPYSNYLIKINKQEVLASTISKKTSAVGNADGSADVEEKIEFELAVDARMHFDDEVKIDGLDYNSAELRKGKHALERKYKIDDAYQIKTENYHANKIGLKTKVEFDYIIDSSIDLQKLTIYMQLNNEKIKDLDIVSLSGESVSNIRKLDNGIVLFDIKDIDANSDATIRIIYNIEDVSDYINEKIALFDSYDLSNDNELRLEEAKDKFAKNDSETALKKIVEIERNMENENSQKQKSGTKYQKIVSELNNELIILQNALEK